MQSSLERPYAFMNIHNSLSYSYSKRHNKFLFPSPAKAIYGSFCRAENEIFNVVNYRILRESDMKIRSETGNIGIVPYFNRHVFTECATNVHSRPVKSNFATSDCVSVWLDLWNATGSFDIISIL